MNDQLQGNELIAMWVLGLLLTPVVPALLYYAWKDSYPNKAKTVNKIAWVSFVIWVTLYLGYPFL